MASKPSRAQLIETAQAYFDAHNNRSPDAIKALSSPTSTHRTGPRPLNTPPKSHDEYYTFHIEVFQLLTWYSAEITDMVVDEDKRKVALFVHAKASAEAGEYENEYVITLTMTEDGKLVQDQYDFIDSYTWMQWMETIQKWMQGKQQAAA